MKSNYLVKCFALTVLASAVLFPLEAKAQYTYSNSQYRSETTREYINRRRQENRQLLGENRRLVSYGAACR